MSQQHKSPRIGTNQRPRIGTKIVYNNLLKQLKRGKIDNDLTLLESLIKTLCMRALIHKSCRSNLFR